jgi:class 3 adenylate cyclase
LACESEHRGSAPGARYCEDCGAAIVRHCKVCDAVLGERARFCAGCGAAAWRADDGERRQLTVLFCDLVESTQLAERLDPEDWQDVLRAYQARAGEVIARHGGHVAQYLGDGLLVYFGWPHAYDDAAERAVRAGLGLVDAAATVRADGTPLAVRVG